jgi:NAD+ diphosphatase
MIQDIYPHRFSNLYLTSQVLSENDYILHYHENTILLKTKGDALALPQKMDFPEITDETDFVFYSA